MFTVLAQEKNKLLVGNRRGRVFQASASWLKRRPHIWTDAVIADSTVVTIPKIERAASFDANSPSPYGGIIEYEHLHLQAWASSATASPVRCGFSVYRGAWFVYQLQPVRRALATMEF